MRANKLWAGAFAGAITVLLASAAQAKPATFTIDGEHAHVGVTVQHFQVSHMRGLFAKVGGSVVYDHADPAKSAAEIRIQTDSFRSESAAREDAIKSEIFLDVATFPEIVFKSTKVEKNEDGFHVTGDLTIRDVTKPVTFPLTINGPMPDPFGMHRMGLEAAFTVDRQEFGMAFDRRFPDGRPWVGNEVVVTISVEATRAATE